MYNATNRQAWVEIDLSALDHNIKEIIKKTGDPNKVVGVIKADGYGHGSVECARVLIENGVTRFAVATIDEAVKLREAGIDGTMVILGITPRETAGLVAGMDLCPVITSYGDAMAVSSAASERGKTVKCLIAFDTGMGRIGYRFEEENEKELAISEIKKITKLPGLEVSGMISHFSSADEGVRDYTEGQIGRFGQIYEELKSEGIDLPHRTIANSAAITEYPEAMFDAVRPGIILYGCYPSDMVDKSLIDLRPVMSVKAQIVHIKKVREGAAVSYGRRFVTSGDTVIATIPIGYADGYSRALSGKVDMIVRGKRVPVIGNICMDQCMIDVTGIGGVKLGDEVTIMGTGGTEEISADELAGKLGTINYEVLCSFGLRLPKVFIR